MKLTKEALSDIAIGSSVLSTGGGLPSSRATLMYKEIGDSGRYPQLVAIEELPPNARICCVSGMGDPSRVPSDIVTPMMHAFGLLERYVSCSFTAIIPGEIGQECVSFLISSRQGVRVLDADLKGGRAAPKPPINTVHLAGQPVTPIAITNTDGDELIINHLSHVWKMEETLRPITALSGALFIAWCPGNRSFYKRHVIHGTITQSRLLGQAIRSAMGSKTDAIIEALPGSKKLFTGKIMNIKKQSTGKFTFAVIKIRESEGKLATVLVQNENLCVKVGRTVKLTCPDLISLVDPVTGRGVHTSEATVGMHVVVIGIPIDNRWKTTRGYELFSPRAFGIDIDPVTI